MAPLTDAEHTTVPAPERTGGPVFDAHVHLFPPRVMEAIWRWFESYGWPIRYRLHAEETVEFLRARGVSRITALLYPHKDGMARALNAFVAEIGRAHRDFVVPLGSVMPGEPGAVDIAREALVDLDLFGLKLHCHVQKLAADDPRLTPIYRVAEDAGKPVLIHAGREPRSPAYGVDTHTLCSADRVERVLLAHPRLRLVVPHLGLDEIDAYRALLTRHPNLYLDTTMAVAGFFPGDGSDVIGEVARAHPGRILYGTDFPNLPYAWDRELRRLAALDEQTLPSSARSALFSGAALAVFGLREK